MRIVLDNIIFSLQRAGGISTYWYELTSRFIKENKQNCQFLDYKKPNKYRSKLQIDSSIASSLPVPLVRFLPSSFCAIQDFVFHSSYYRYSKCERAVNIVTVHDMIYENLITSIPYMLLKHQKKQAIIKADGIICVSENTRKDLLEFFPDKEDCIEVIHNGVSNDFVPLSDEKSNSGGDVESGKEYVLYVGSRARYKNFGLAVRSVSMIKDLDLLVFGGGSLTSAEARLLDKHLPDRHRYVSWTGTKKLNSLYNKALCLLYPSIYEGFGLPVAEAMKAGCPVVAVKASSIPEVCGNAGLLVDEPSEDQIVQKLNELKDPVKREEQIKMGINQSKKYSWDKCYNKTASFYEKVLEVVS